MSPELSRTATGGETYASLGKIVDEAKEQYGEDSDEAAAAQALRTTAMNASLLRGSLFTSVLAFGVSALATGTGLVTLLGGTVLVRREDGKLVEAKTTPAPTAS